MASVSGLPTAFGDLRSVFRKVGASPFPRCLGHVLGTDYRPSPQAGRLPQASPVGFPVFSRSAPRAAQPGGRSPQESPRPSQPEGRPNGKHFFPLASSISQNPRYRLRGCSGCSGRAGTHLGAQGRRGDPGGRRGLLTPSLLSFFSCPAGPSCRHLYTSGTRSAAGSTPSNLPEQHGTPRPGLSWGRGRHQLEVGSTVRSREARGGPGWEPSGARTVSRGVGWRRVCGTDVHGLGNRDPPGRVRVVAPAPQGRRRGRETQLRSWTLPRGVRDFSGGRKKRRKWHRGMLR